MKIAVVGAGSWGTALALVAARNGHDTRLWARSAVAAASLADSRRAGHFLTAIEPTTGKIAWRRPYPGGFGGGLIDLKTIAVPDSPFLSVGTSLGLNDETSLKRGLTYYGGDTDFLGIDDGTRELPQLIRRGIESGRRIDSSNFDDATLTAMGRSFQNANINLLQSTNDVPINGSVDVSAGTSWALQAREISAKTTSNSCSSEMESTWVWRLCQRTSRELGGRTGSSAECTGSMR